MRLIKPDLCENEMVFSWYRLLKCDISVLYVQTITCLQNIAYLQNKIYNSVSGMDFHLNSMKKSFFLLLNQSCLWQRLLISLSALFGAKVSLYPGLLWFSIFCPISDKCILWLYGAVSFLARWSCGNVQFMDVTIWTENTVLKAIERFD